MEERLDQRIFNNLADPICLAIWGSFSPFGTHCLPKCVAAAEQTVRCKADPIMVMT